MKFTTFYRTLVLTCLVLTSSSMPPAAAEVDHRSVIKAAERRIRFSTRNYQPSTAKSRVKTRSASRLSIGRLTSSRRSATTSRRTPKIGLFRIFSGRGKEDKAEVAAQVAAVTRRPPRAEPKIAESSPVQSPQLNTFAAEVAAAPEPAENRSLKSRVNGALLKFSAVDSGQDYSSPGYAETLRLLRPHEMKPKPMQNLLPVRGIPSEQEEVTVLPPTKRSPAKAKPRSSASHRTQNSSRSRVSSIRYINVPLEDELPFKEEAEPDTSLGGELFPSSIDAIDLENLIDEDYEYPENGFPE